jgi:hypothetical protein
MSSGSWVAALRKCIAEAVHVGERRPGNYHILGPAVHLTPMEMLKRIGPDFLRRKPPRPKSRMTQGSGRPSVALTILIDHEFGVMHVVPIDDSAFLLV